MKIESPHSGTSFVRPLEKITVHPEAAAAVRLLVEDGESRNYLDRPIGRGRKVVFKARGSCGWHTVRAVDANGLEVERTRFRLRAETGLSCDGGPYAELRDALQRMIVRERETDVWDINGRLYRFLICWSRDHVYTLKAARYFMADVKSGLDYWMETQEPNGMFWDNIYLNREDPAPTWLGEALGSGWYRYDEGLRYIVRRVPVLADTEYVFTEGVWYAWKATGDDAWMATQMPRLERALTYMTSDPLRWSEGHGLVRRSFTADEWDFANPHYCAGDHRCINPGDPTFFFHGNNSGLYAMMWRMAEMYEHLGQAGRACELREQAEGLRARANEKLFFGKTYGHMIPESIDAEEVFRKSGDERERMSLSLGYTINRGLPTHEMAVSILREYQKRRKQRAAESFSEWWTMDPPYTPEQWPSQDSGTAGCPEGEYMNGGICPIVAGEIARAAFEHGLESYGADILERVWDLTVRDGGHLHQVYRRLPEEPMLPPTAFTTIDLSSVVNRGLRNGAEAEVEGWTGEGDNDLRNLPVGLHCFGAIAFSVIDPKRNRGRAVLRLSGGGENGPVEQTIPVENLRAGSLYFLHATARSAPEGAVVAYYDVHYEDGSRERIHIRQGKEIGHWWGTNDSSMDRSRTRRGWWGPNPQWKNVGVYMHGWSNPHPDRAVTAIRVRALPLAGGRGGVMLAAVSASDQAVAFEPKIRSYGLPDCWAQAAVYYAIVEGLIGIEDRGAAFSKVRVSPRWASSKASRAEATLHYPASDGYCAYACRIDRKARRLTIDLTGSFESAELHCLLPEGPAKRVTVDGKSVPFTNARIERSRYADLALDSLPEGPIVIEY